MRKFREVQKRQEILKFYREKGIKRTQRKYSVSWSNISQYLKQETQVSQEEKQAEVIDADQSKKRKRKCTASTRRVKKKTRVGKSGPERSPQYIYMDNRISDWFKKQRKTGCLVTPKMVRKFAKTACKIELKVDLSDPDYWYRSFRNLHRIVLRRVTGLRRKRYTKERV